MWLQTMPLCVQMYSWFSFANCKFAYLPSTYRFQVKIQVHKVYGEQSPLEPKTIFPIDSISSNTVSTRFSRNLALMIMRTDSISMCKYIEMWHLHTHPHKTNYVGWGGLHQNVPVLYVKRHPKGWTNTNYFNWFNYKTTSKWWWRWILLGNKLQSVAVFTSCFHRNANVDLAFNTELQVAILEASTIIDYDYSY